MHYGAYAFAKNRYRPTIIAKKGNGELGQRKGFSPVISPFISVISLSFCGCQWPSQSNRFEKKKKMLPYFFLVSWKIGLDNNIKKIACMIIIHNEVSKQVWIKYGQSKKYFIHCWLAIR